MPGMMRFKSEEDFQKMLKGTHLRISKPITGKPQEARAPAAPIGPVMGKPTGSDIEELFAQQLALTKLPPAVREYHHLRGSKHRLDFAWPDLMLGVEVQGMAHRVRERFQGDIKKRAAGLLQGWRVLEVDGASVRDGTAMQWLHELFELVNKGE